MERRHAGLQASHWPGSELRPWSSAWACGLGCLASLPTRQSSRSGPVPWQLRYTIMHTHTHTLRLMHAISRGMVRINVTHSLLVPQKKAAAACFGTKIFGGSFKGLGEVSAEHSEKYTGQKNTLTSTEGSRGIITLKPGHRVPVVLRPGLRCSLLALETDVIRESPEPPAWVRAAGWCRFHAQTKCQECFFYEHTCTHTHSGALTCRCTHLHGPAESGHILRSRRHWHTNIVIGHICELRLG